MLAQSEKSKNEINQQLKQTQDQLETVEEENDELVLEITQKMEMEKKDYQL